MRCVWATLSRSGHYVLASGSKCTREKLRGRGDARSICALVPYPPNTAPSQRFRIEQWRTLLQAEGIRVDLVPFADSTLVGFLHQFGRPMAKSAALATAFGRRFATLASLGKYDGVVVHRGACLFGPALLEHILRLRRPLIFDFDDAIFLPHTTSANRRFGWLKFSGKTASICGLSAHVVVGNEYLASYARQYNPHVTVIPSSVDTDRYRPRSKENGDRLVVGWMGTSTSQTYLELFAPVLRQLSEKWPVEIRVVSNRVPHLPGVPFVWRPWSCEAELEDLRAFDIGIMPMPDDPWARGKCAMKALLYMSVGLSVICSAVGTNLEVIRHGENGLLATSSEEWLTCFQALINDPELRRRLGEAGRATVESQYSMHRCASLFGQVVRQTLDGLNPRHGRQSRIDVPWPPL